MTEAKRVVVVGSLNYDILLGQTRLPSRGETLHCRQAATASGGKGANQAVQAAKLGATVYLVGAVGQDALGDALLASCRSYGVHTDFVRRSEGASGLGVVQCLPDGSVYATVAEGANGSVTPDRVRESETCLAQADAILLQFEIPMETNAFVMAYARQKGIPVLLNPSPAKAEGRPLLAAASCLILNEQEASFFCGEALCDAASVAKHRRALQALNARRMIVTLGAQGSVLVEPDGVCHIRPTGLARVVETTGAGDSYAGAYAVRRLMGDEPAAACRYACRAAEYTIGQAGAQNAMPTRQNMEGA